MTFERRETRLRLIPAASTKVKTITRNFPAVQGVIFKLGCLFPYPSGIHRIRDTGKEAILRVLSTAALVSVIALGAGFSYLLWRGSEPGGIDDAYALVFGPADQGPVEFAGLTRTSAPHDALACPQNVCANVPVDIVTPVYPISGEELRSIVRDVAAAQPRTQIVYSARWEEQDRFVVRSAVMRFPDTVNVRIFGAGDQGSMLALYSRSQIGYSDMGVNLERLYNWLAAIEERVCEAVGDSGSSIRISPEARLDGRLSQLRLC